MRGCFGKAREQSFRGFIGAEQALSGQTSPEGRSCQNWRKSPALGQELAPREAPGDTMDQPLKSRGQGALDDAFQHMFELSRTTPAPTLTERLDRLARLRAAISDNETRFEQAISADFGHRSSIE